MQKLLSLIISTNGITEWVLQVVESIYNQDIDDSLFEVVVTDNGEGDECKNAVVSAYGHHSNLRYKKTSTKLFLNQIEAFKLAKGLFVKFINHRAVMNFGSIHFLLDFVIKHKDEEEKPITFFINSDGKHKGEEIFNSFDAFVRGLSYFSSWSGGLASWKEDFEQLPADLVYDPLYPHTAILFYFVSRRNYIINYAELTHDISADHSKKGKYNLYYAFGVEYPFILLKLMMDKSITAKTFMYVKNANRKFLADCYRNFNILHRPHSYDLSGAKEYLNVFYDYNKIVCSARIMGAIHIGKSIAGKLLRLILRIKE